MKFSPTSMSIWFETLALNLCGSVGTLLTTRPVNPGVNRPVFLHAHKLSKNVLERIKTDRECALGKEREREVERGKVGGGGGKPVIDDPGDKSRLGTEAAALIVIRAGGTTDLDWSRERERERESDGDH